MCSAASRVSGSEVEAARRWRAPSADGGSPWTELGLQPRTEELEAIREAARAEGYAAGLAQGQEEARVARRRLEAVVEAAAAGLTRMDGPLLDEIARVVLSATRCVLRTETRLDPEHLRSSLASALAELGDDERDIVLRVSPEDLSLAEAEIAAGPHAARTTVLAAAELERGGVDLVCGPTRVDDSLEARLEAALEPLLAASPR